MRKAIFLSIAALYFVLVGCSSEQATKPRWFSVDNRIKVLSTTAMIDDVVGAIGKDRIDHIALVVGEIDPHSYELVKGDDEKIDAADIVFYNGLNLEHGASLCYKLSKHSKAIALGDYILQQHPECILRVGAVVDPHIWMDIMIWKEVIDPILEGLITVDPQGKEIYEKNASALKETMLHVHHKVMDILHRIPEEKRYLVTSHDAFGYFARRYLATEEERVSGDWKKRFAAPEGLAPDGQISAYDLKKIIDHLQEYQIAVVFPESNVSRDSLKKIVDACGEKDQKIQFSTEALYGDSMGPQGALGGSYLGMIEHNALILSKQWQ